MYRKIIVNLFLLSVVFASCSTTHQLKIYDGPSTVRLVEFCTIDKALNGEFIRTTAMYTNIEEYWGLTSNKNCIIAHQVYLNTAELNKTLLKEFDKAHKNQTEYSLKLKITGKVDLLDDSIEGGKEDNKKMQIIPYYIEILEKQELK